MAPNPNMPRIARSPRLHHNNHVLHNFRVHVLPGREKKRKKKNRLRLSASIQREAKYYTGLPRATCTMYTGTEAAKMQKASMLFAAWYTAAS